MAISYQAMSDIIDKMDALTRPEFAKHPLKLWENTHLKIMNERRKKGETEFPIDEHLRAMVYAMLSSGISWARVEKYTEPETGNLPCIDKVFSGYEPSVLAGSNPHTLSDSVKNLGCASLSTKAQMTALVNKNLPKLLAWQAKYGSIDNYYQGFLKKDPTGELLVKELSRPNGANKLVQMGEALASEYLRNVGYDLPKPDRHICRILGSERLGFGKKKCATVDEVFKTAQSISAESQRRIAEVDYILWSYCAKDYGEICTANNPKCDKCAAKEYCNYPKKEGA